MFRRDNLYMNLKSFSMAERFQVFLRYAPLSIMVNILVGSGGLVSAAPIQAPEPNELLNRYHQALQQLPIPTQKRYTQQIQTTNWQESSATADFHFQENGGWEAKIIDNGDRLRQLNSSQVELVDTTDSFRLSTTDPEKLAANQSIDLDATPETYTPTALETKEEVGVSTQKSSSPIADRIAKFNLSKPSYSDPTTNINTFLTLKMGKANLLMYLVRFNFAGSLP